MSAFTSELSSRIWGPLRYLLDFRVVINYIEWNVIGNNLKQRNVKKIKVEENDELYESKK